MQNAKDHKTMHIPADIPLASWIRDIDAKGEIYRFYKTVEWQALRAAVLADHYGECEICAANGKYTPAVTVHHEYEVRKHPDMALTRWIYMPDGTRREVLHPLCHRCHDDVHERGHGAPRETKKSALREERW